MTTREMEGIFIDSIKLIHKNKQDFDYIKKYVLKKFINIGYTGINLYSIMSTTDNIALIKAMAGYSGMPKYINDIYNTPSNYIKLMKN
jgi:hypothetical protein